MVVLRLAWLLCLWACFGLTPARASVVDVGQALEWNLRLVDQVRLFKDISGNMDVQQVAYLPDGPSGFARIDQLSDAGEVAPTPWWSKVQLRNTGNASRALRLVLSPGSVFHSADFYVERNDQWLPALQAKGVTAAEEPGTARFHSIAIDLEPGQSRTILIRTTGVAPSRLAPYLYSQARFNNYLAHSTVWDGLLFGGLLALAWTAGMLALFARSRGFLLLGLLSFSTLLTEALRRGYDKLYLLPETIEWGYRGPLVLGNLTILLFILFVLEIPRAEKVRLPLRKLLVGWALYYSGLMLLSAFGDVYQVHWLNEHLRPLFSLSLLAVAILFIKHNAPTRKLMLAVAVFSLVRASLVTLETSGMLPDYIASLSMGTLRMNPVLALSSFFLNLTLLAAWVAHVGVQRKGALEKISRLQREENQRLAKEVAKQTSALNEALKYADEKNRQQTQIVGYISHDLRAPLATVAGYAKLLQQTASKQQEPQLNAIVRSVDYQMALIDDILAYAASELKPLSLKREPTRLADYLDEITLHATALSKQHNNHFTIEVSSRIPKTIWLDGRRLRQVLLNLLSNAAKFTQGGKIGLDLAATPTDTGWQLRFVVRDSGIGIDPRRQAQIFKEFRQLEPNSAGVGLGLYIAQSILRSMGAELSLDSSIGQGARFSFTINVAAADDHVVNWTAPATLPLQDTAALNAVDAISSPTPSVASTAGLASRNLSVPMPPAHLRSELAIMARDGHLSDIESWLRVTMGHYPTCATYFHRIQEALGRLDLDAVERLATAQPRGDGRS